MRTFLAFLILLQAAGAVEAVKPHPANPNYFLFRGKPMIIVSSAEHYGAVLNQDFDWKKYLDTMAHDGMNYVRIFSGSYREVPGDFGIERNTLAPAPGRFLAPWARKDGKFDLSKWDEAYFTRLKEFVAAAGERGLIVEVTLFCSTYSAKQWAVSPFHSDNNSNGTTVRDFKELHTKNNGNVLGFQEAMTRRVVRELNGFDNVLYEIQNEPWADRGVPVEAINRYQPAKWPNSVDLADEASLEWQRLVASWIHSEEAALPVKHSVAWNVCNFLSSLKAMLPGANVVNFHYAYPEAALWNTGLNVPIAYDETGFIGKTDAAYRREAWRFLLAGGGAFNHLDYSFSVGHEDGMDSQPKSPGGGSTALRRQFRVLSEVLHGLPFLRMKADLATVRYAPGVEWQAFSSAGEAYLIYVRGGSPAELTLQMAAGQYSAEWINTLDGTVIEKRPLVRRGGTVKLRSPAFTDDVALRIRK